MTGVDTLPGAGLFLPGMSSTRSIFAFSLGLIPYLSMLYPDQCYNFHRSETLQLAKDLLFTGASFFIFVFNFEHVYSFYRKVSKVRILNPPPSRHHRFCRILT